MKKSLKIIIFICIIAALLVGVFFLIRNTPFKNDEKEAKINVQKGTFEYVPAFEKYSVEDTFYYSDDYFKNSGEEQNEHLRTMSMCLALSSITAIDKENKAENAENLLENIGFSDIVTNDIKEETTRDSIGTAIAHKKINGKEIIAVSIRGGQYLREWASNMTAGKSGDIAGFAKAAEIVENRIKEYKETYDIDECKIWITGYSRGGSVANLVGKYINENLNEFDISKNDLYVYTFEAPLCSSSEIKYKNIHNVVNKNDFIIYVYPKKWGIYNNGVEEVIDSESKNIAKKQIDIAGGFQINNMLDDNGDVIYINQEEFLEDFVNWLTKKNSTLNYTLTREKYTELLEESLSKIIVIIADKTSAEKREILEFLEDIAQELIKEDNLNILKNELPDFKSMNFDFDYDKIFKIVENSIDSVYENSAVALSKEEFQDIKDSIIPIAKATVPILIASAFDGNTKLNLSNFEISGFYHLATFIYNIGDVIKDHYYQTNIKLVQEMDSYYTN